MDKIFLIQTKFAHDEISNFACMFIFKTLAVINNPGKSCLLFYSPTVFYTRPHINVLLRKTCVKLLKGTTLYCKVNFISCTPHVFRCDKKLFS